MGRERKITTNGYYDNPSSPLFTLLRIPVQNLIIHIMATITLTNTTFDNQNEPPRQT